MAAPSEKLAQSLEALAKLQRVDGEAAIRARDLTRTHRERCSLKAFSRWLSRAGSFPAARTMRWREYGLVCLLLAILCGLPQRAGGSSFLKSSVNSLPVFLVISGTAH